MVIDFAFQLTCIYSLHDLDGMYYGLFGVNWVDSQDYRYWRYFLLFVVDSVERNPLAIKKNSENRPSRGKHHEKSVTSSL